MHRGRFVGLSLLVLLLFLLCVPASAKKKWPHAGDGAWVSGGAPVSLCGTEREIGAVTFENVRYPSGYNGFDSFVVWRDVRLGPAGDLFAQRIRFTGWPLWPENGVAVTFDSAGAERFHAVSDEGGGLVVVYVSGQPPEQDILAQRMSPAGRRRWDPPVALADGAGPQRVDEVWKFVVTDREGGAIAAWQDCTADPQCDIRAGRVTTEGVAVWGSGGVAVATASGPQGSPLVVADDAGGAVIVWTDGRSGDEIYAQRLDADGAPLWAVDGVRIAAGLRATDIVPDGEGGAIVSLEDPSGDGDVHLQRVTADGSLPWSAPVEVTQALGTPQWARIGAHFKGGATVGWCAEPSGTEARAQWVDLDGDLRWDPQGNVVAQETGPAGIARPVIHRHLAVSWMDLEPTETVRVQYLDYPGGKPYPSYPPYPLSPDTTGTDRVGLTYSYGPRDEPMEAFHSSRCSPDGIWLQYVMQIDSGMPPEPCPPPPYVCSDGQVVCGSCDALLRTLELSPIDGHGIRNSLESKAEAACAALERGQRHTFANILCALLHEVDALEGKKIPPGTAWDLRACVRELAAAEGVELPCDEE